MFTGPFLDIPPLQGASGTVHLPGSKSISNRVLLLAGLAQGTTVIHDLLQSDDTRVMLQALRQLGCGVVQQEQAWHITGLGGRLKAHQAELFLGNAGTAMRPLTAALAVLAATQGGDFTVSGVPRMHERPIGDLVDALRPLGCTVEDLGQPGYPPLRLRGEAGGVLNTQAPIRVRGDVSSQFLTALLLALPLVTTHSTPVTPHASSTVIASGTAAKQSSTSSETSSATSVESGSPIVIEVMGELISKPYIEITLRLLARFGVEVQRDGFERFVIPAGSRYTAPGEIYVEGDASSASYFIAMGALAATEQAPVRIEGVGHDSIQGDIRFVEAAQAMGAVVRSGPNWLEVHRGAWPLKGLTLNCNHMPDAAMTLAVMALYADAPTRLTHIGSWRVKETDRLEAMSTELRKLGAQVVEGPDFIEVSPLPAASWRAASWHTYDDHRMAMCGSLAAFSPGALGRSPRPFGPRDDASAVIAKPAGLKQSPANHAELKPSHPPIRIEDPACVAKTFPDYFEAFFALVQADSEHIPVITIDGPSASGKGTLASAVAARLGYHLLDSGALYRATGVAAERAGIPLTDEQACGALAAAMHLRFEGDRVYLDGEDISDELRQEEAGVRASRVAAMPPVRQALHQLQLSFRKVPGLVGDGRDMGTVIFPDAALKVFLTASAAQRAQRRHKQLISKGIQAKLEDLRAELEARDARDKSRSVAPLVPAQDALMLDNSELGIDESVNLVLQWWAQRRPFLT